MQITNLGRLMLLHGQLRARRKRANQDLERLKKEVRTTDPATLPGDAYMEYMINACEQLGTLRSRIANVNGIMSVLSIQEFRAWSWIRFGLNEQPDHKISDNQVSQLILEHAPELLLELIEEAK